MNRIEHRFNIKINFWFLGRKPIFAQLAPDAGRRSSTLKIGGVDAHPNAANGGHPENGNKAGDFVQYSDSGKYVEHGSLLCGIHKLSIRMKGISICGWDQKSKHFITPIKGYLA